MLWLLHNFNFYDFQFRSSNMYEDIQVHGSLHYIRSATGEDHL